MRLCERGLGVVDRDLGVGRLQRRDSVPGLQHVAASDIFARYARDFDRRDGDILALDIADGRVRRRRASRQDAGDQPNGADRFQNHDLPPRAWAMATSRLSVTTRLIAAASASPISRQFIRRRIAGRARRK